MADIDHLKHVAAGRWPEILTHVGGIDAASLDGKNHPCPLCGGTDRFRFIDEAAGACFCNQCFNKGNGDGLAAIQWACCCDFPTAVKLVSEYLGIDKVPGSGDKPSVQIVATYDYRDEKSELLYQVVRFEPKDFRQRRPKVGGGWDWSVKGVRSVLYRLPELAKAEPGQPVFVVEGEKDADRLTLLGLLSTTNAGGAGKWKAEYTQLLHGRTVIILPDNDEPGEQHAIKVAAELRGVAASVKILRLPGLPEKGDVSTWLDLGGTEAELWKLVDTAAEWSPVVIVPVHEAEQPRGPIDPGPFPERLLRVPGFIGDVMDWNLSGAFKPQPVLALGGALSLLGTLTGRKIADAFGSRTNLYVLSLCETGGGKEHARKVNKEILFEAGMDKMIGPEGIASAAGLVNAIEQQPAMLMQLDEIGRLLKTLGDARTSPHLYNIVTVLLKLFSSSSSIFKNDAYADVEKNRTLNQPHLCIYGTTVPASFFDGLSTESLTDGFMSRLLVLETNDHDPDEIEPTLTRVPDKIIEAARWWGDFVPGGNMAATNPEPIIVEYSDEAASVIRALSSLSRAERNKGTAEAKAIWTRAVEKARKLALLYACSEDRECPIIHTPGAAWASDMSEFLTRKIIYFANQWVGENAYQRTKQRVMRTIGSCRDGISASELGARTRYLRPKERDELLEDLRSSLQIVIESSEFGRGIMYRALR